MRFGQSDSTVTQDKGEGKRREARRRRNEKMKNAKPTTDNRPMTRNPS
jgi:hypothetical protein